MQPLALIPPFGLLRALKERTALLVKHEFEHPHRRLSIAGQRCGYAAQEGRYRDVSRKGARPDQLALYSERHASRAT
jgi:hypothetical protein